MRTRSLLFSMLGVVACACAGTLAACDAAAPTGGSGALVASPGELRGVTATAAASAASTAGDKGLCEKPVLSDYIVSGSVTTTRTDDAHIAEVTLIVVDGDGNPVPDIELTGLFTGDIKAAATLTTDAEGIARATTTGGGQHLIVGFTVLSSTRVSEGTRVPVTATTEVIYPSPCCQGKTPPSG